MGGLRLRSADEATTKAIGAALAALRGVSAAEVAASAWRSSLAAMPRLEALLP